jgi:DNA-binding transcriptional ArsR family regulator
MMNVARQADVAVSGIASAIGEPARVRILYSLLDGHARTSTELAAVANVSPSTTSAHLNRLHAERLIKVLVQGKHRYYSLAGPNVASALEGLSVLAGTARDEFVQNGFMQNGFAEKVCAKHAQPPARRARLLRSHCRNCRCAPA